MCLSQSTELNQIVLILLKYNIPLTVELVKYDEFEVIGYVVPGFSKSGTATILYDPRNKHIVCVTRYGRIVPIESLEDLSEEAWFWYTAYKDRSSFENPSETWLPFWLKDGRLIEETTIKYKVK